MNIVCLKDRLIENINTVLKAVSSKTTMPILQCIFLNADSEFKLVANDLEMGIETSAIGAEILEKGSVALEAKIFSDIVRKMPGEYVEIKTDNKNITTIKSGRSEFKIMGLDGDEFPVLPYVEKNTGYEVSGLELKNMIRQTIFSVSVDESKQVLTGEFFEFKNNVFSIVAIDGFRISYRKTDITFLSDMSAVVPAKTLNEISRIISDGSFVTIYITDKHILFQLDNATVVSRLLEGEFMKYNNIFNDDYNTIIYANRQEFLSSLERASLISAKDGKKHPVKLRIEKDSVIITSNTETGTSYEELFIEVNGASIEISFNPKYLTDVLKAIEDERVCMQFTTELSPCIIKAAGNNNGNYLVLPLRR